MQSLAVADPSHRSHRSLLCHDSELRPPCNFSFVPISLQISLSNEKAGDSNVLSVGTWYSFKSYLAVN